MNPLELWKHREKGLTGHKVQVQGSNFWSKRNVAVLRKSKTYDSEEKFSAKPLISSDQSLHEFACTGLPRVFKENPVDIGKVNKVFAAQWLDQDHVILGTKCNHLLVCNLSSKSRKWMRNRRKSPSDEKRSSRKRNFQGEILERIDTPSSSSGEGSSSGSNETTDSSIKWIPSLRSSSRSKWNRELGGNASGVHTIKINPSGTMFATGALYPSDVAVYSLPDFQPVAVGEGHYDWLFDVDWLDDEYLISGSRDSTLALWRFRNDEDRITCSHVTFVNPPNPGTTGNNNFLHNYSREAHGEDEEIVQKCPDSRWATVKLKRKYPAIEPVTTSKVRKFDKVRALSVNHKQKSVTAVSLNSHLCVTDLGTMKQRKTEKLSESFSECVCLCHSSDENLLAIGSRDHFTFFDTHSLREVKDVTLPSPHGNDEVDMFSSVIPTGVRSISWQGPMVTVGTGCGDLLFYDVRNCSFLECEGYGCFPRLHVGEGYTRQEYFHLDYPFPTAVYAHCYDDSGMRLFAAGGPIASIKQGNYAGLWQ